MTYFYTHWCFDCMYVSVGVLQVLGLELQTDVSWELNRGSLKEQPVLLAIDHLYSPNLLPYLTVYSVLFLFFSFGFSRQGFSV